MKALFLDRDGVINVDVGYGYRIDQMQFIPGIFEFTKKLSDAGYAIIVVTNQAGIGRGYYSEADFHALSQWMVGQFAARGVTITAVKFCPHHPQATLPQYQLQCACRKPLPGMLNEAIAQFGIDAPRSLMIGDKATDMMAGYTAGVGALYLLGEHSEWLSLNDSVRARVTHITQFGDMNVAPER